MNKLALLLGLSTLSLSMTASAAHWCEAYIDAVVPSASGITVVATSSYNGRSLDILTKDYDDGNFGAMYMRLLDAKKGRYVVRVYPVEAKGEEDGVSCTDGTQDYLRTVVRPF
ncbi:MULTISPECIES: hypothetical protein [unclassified Pseudoalteromonas]|uniref:hypothetical protein n=1 Tax=unclassified Pseudoalteromonas TaxID=194690 RepID=UPI001B3A3205|nr:MULTISPECIES: hypothetical protein [unclassified Pseudoalteromonas]MBQ4844648.1 hypothetical protein [Pseudoalteromonas sp. MMG005]MBQ4850412.1 hypothetical protein [Pseudoalteromonas sp. MMG012]